MARFQGLLVESQSRLEFRPPAPLRYGLAFLGAFTFLAAGIQLNVALVRREPTRLPAACILLVPTVLAMAVFRRSLALDEKGIYAQGFGPTRFIPYTIVRRVDERRASVAIQTSSDALTSAWLSPADRQRLLREVVERAMLTRTAEEPPFGVLARYVPRTADIGFIPHHSKRRVDSGDSGGVVSSD